MFTVTLTDSQDLEKLMYSVEERTPSLCAYNHICLCKPGTCKYVDYNGIDLMGRVLMWTYRGTNNSGTTCAAALCPIIRPCMHASECSKLSWVGVGETGGTTCAGPSTITWCPGVSGCRSGSTERGWLPEHCSGWPALFVLTHTTDVWSVLLFSLSFSLLLGFPSGKFCHCTGYSAYFHIPMCSLWHHQLYAPAHGDLHMGTIRKVEV